MLFHMNPLQTNNIQASFLSSIDPVPCSCRFKELIENRLSLDVIHNVQHSRLLSRMTGSPQFRLDASLLFGAPLSWKIILMQNPDAVLLLQFSFN